MQINLFLAVKLPSGGQLHIEWKKAIKINYTLRHVWMLWMPVKMY